MHANGITINYEVQGDGEPLVLIPYLAADQACYAGFTPELYDSRPDYIESLAEFVRWRPMPPVDAFLRQSEALLHHDAVSQLPRIQAPTLLTFGGRDAVTSVIFEGCSHAPIYEQVEEFNTRTLAFLHEHAG